MVDLADVPAWITYHPRRHAAVRTHEYIYAQLIPYIGNKRRLLPLIARGIAATACHGGLFVDLFTGSTVVARLAKTLGFRVAANDWEPYSYEIARGTVANNHPPAFASLGGVEAVFHHLNALPPLHGYIATHLCPADDERPDPRHERLFFTRQNGERIDAIREQIAAWEAAGALTEAERAYLLSALVYAVSYVSNTSGVFKGFHEGWGGQTGTALYRIRSVLRVRPPVLYDNGAENLALRADAQQLARELPMILGREPDIVYLDPPYNQHPYGSNYHVLNTVVLWDKPAITARFAPGRRDKSAIRTDWRVERRSPYNSSRTALPAFAELINALSARWILLSYSTDGTMPVEAVLQIMAERGSVRVLAHRYRRYRVSTPRKSPRPYTVEFLVILDTRGRSSRGRVDQLVEQILREEGRSHGDVSPAGDFEFSYAAG
jgi:adenine-specific DNA-methyltransferase